MYYFLSGVDGHSARRDFLNYALSLMRCHNDEHGDNLPVMDISSLRHVAYVLDALIYYMRSGTDPDAEMIRDGASVHSWQDQDETLNDETDEEPIVKHGVAMETDSIDGEESELMDNQAAPSSNGGRKHPFFQRTDSVTLLGCTAPDPFQVPLVEALPLADQPQLLQPNSRKEELFGMPRRALPASCGDNTLDSVTNSATIGSQSPFDRLPTHLALSVRTAGTGLPPPGGLLHPYANMTAVEIPPCVNNSSITPPTALTPQNTEKIPATSDANNTIEQLKGFVTSSTVVKATDLSQSSSQQASNTGATSVIVKPSASLCSISTVSVTSSTSSPAKYAASTSTAPSSTDTRHERLLTDSPASPEDNASSDETRQLLPVFGMMSSQASVIVHVGSAGPATIPITSIASTSHTTSHSFTANSVTSSAPSVSTSDMGSVTSGSAALSGITSMCYPTSPVDFSAHGAGREDREERRADVVNQGPSSFDVSGNLQSNPGQSSSASTIAEQMMGALLTSYSPQSPPPPPPPPPPLHLDSNPGQVLPTAGGDMEHHHHSNVVPQSLTANQNGSDICGRGDVPMNQPEQRPVDNTDRYVTSIDGGWAFLSILVLPFFKFYVILLLQH